MQTSSTGFLPGAGEPDLVRSWTSEYSYPTGPMAEGSRLDFPFTSRFQTRLQGVWLSISREPASAQGSVQVRGLERKSKNKSPENLVWLNVKSLEVF